MGLKHVSQQSTDRFFVIDDQNALECKEGLMGGSVKEQRHNLRVCCFDEEGNRLAQWMSVCVAIFKGLKRTVRSGAPFVPIYFKKLQVVSLSPENIFIAEEQQNVALSQYFDGWQLHC
jgi:hypothetical protein